MLSKQTTAMWLPPSQPGTHEKILIPSLKVRILQDGKEREVERWDHSQLVPSAKSVLH